MIEHVRTLSQISWLTVVAMVFSAGCSAAKDAGSPAITSMGNGEFNAIETDGLLRDIAPKSYTGQHVTEAATLGFRMNSIGITFPKVTIDRAGWIVLHPVMDGKPNGDIVSGFSYLEAGSTSDVTVNLFHPADPGSKYLVMLHYDLDEDGVFDFVFVEDGVNVEDRAVTEGSKMIPHFISLP